MTSEVHKSRPWGDVPDFTFFFYDPWRSFFDECPPEFRNAKGEKVVASRSLSALLHIGEEAAKTLKSITSEYTIDDWKGLIVGARNLMAEMRINVPLDRIKFVGPDGLEITEPISMEDSGTQDLVRFLTQVLASGEAPAEDRTICLELWCLVCFEHIDSAVLAQLFDDAGDGVSAVLYAHDALQEAQRLVASPPKPSMAFRGATARHASNNRARAWVRIEWETHRGEYANNKSEFSRHYVRRVLHEFSVTITEKQMREVWLRDTPSASIPAG